MCVDGFGDTIGSGKVSVSTPRVFAVAVNGPAIALATGALPGREMHVQFTAQAGDLVGLDFTERSAEWGSFDQRLVRVATGETVPKFPAGTTSRRTVLIASNWGRSGPIRCRPH